MYKACGTAGKESSCSAGDLGSTPGLGRSPGEGKGYPLQYSGLENSTDCRVHGVTKNQTGLSDFHFGEGDGTLLQYSCLKNSIDGGAWWAAVHGFVKSWTRLSDSLSLLPFMHWRRKWQPTPVFLPGESQGRGSLVGCCIWGHTELDMTEVT